MGAYVVAFYALRYVKNPRFRRRNISSFRKTPRFREEKSLLLLLLCIVSSRKLRDLGEEKVSAFASNEYIMSSIIRDLGELRISLKKFF